jgi:sn-glycerol 3-phosphate transport system substrate-binding protein
MMRTKGKGIIAVLLLLSLVVLTACGGESSSSDKPVALTFYFPVAVGGPVTQQIETMVTDFTAKNPNIKVTPVFAGNYTETMNKVQTAIQGQQTPDVAVLLATDVFTLHSMKAIVPFDEMVAADKEGKAWLADFTPGFMGNSKLENKTWSVPFQRSTVVLYYNKDLFKAAGLDPEKAPKNWEELVSFGKQLTKSGQWGLEIPSDGNPSWIFSSFFIQQGKHVVNEAGTEVAFNSPEVITSLAFIQALSKSHKIMPEGVIKWGDVPNNFAAGKTAMIYHTTGSIGNLRKTMAPEKIGVAPLPAGKKYGAPTGGGNLYILKTTKEREQAAYKFVKFMTETDRVAQWSAETGYIPARKSATESKIWKDAVAGFAGLGKAADALQYSEREIAAYQNQQVLKAFGDQLQTVVTGTKPIKDAMDQAQKDATTILVPFKK